VKKTKIFFLFLSIFLLVKGEKTEAINNVNIATIGKGSPVLNKSLTMQEKVDQMIVFWHNELAQVLPDQPDLIVLPEVCDQAGGLNLEEKYQYYKVRGNQFLNFLASVAKENHCYIAFGTKRIDEEENWRNLCVLVDREGEIAGIYNKNYITFRAIEFGTKAGDQTPIFKTDFGTIGCAICFDLNFDELRQKYAKLKPNLILFPSMYHGGLVQSYWAYSSESYFVGSIGVSNVPR
jgi:predicted amidohydrolase